MTTGGVAPLRWGVIGATSQVATKAVLPAIAASPRARLVAVASRATRLPFHLPDVRVHPTYAALLDDPAVEAVYVPLPNSLHREWVERAAASGKHVLCEKPLAMTARDADTMAGVCAKAGVTLLEAYMTPFHPRSRAIELVVDDGTLGELRFARTAFTGVLDRPDDHRWHGAMGGGALLDLGVYCVAPLLAAARRPPVRVEAVASRSPAGVDASFSGWLEFGDGFAASIECSFDAPERQLLEIVGTRASVAVDRAFTPGREDTAFTLLRRDGLREEMVGDGGDPYGAMIEHFHAVVREGVIAHRSPADAIGVLEVLDRLRKAAGLVPAA